MRPGGGKPATAIQVAMFGHIAAAMRQALAAKGWKPADLNRAIGRPRGAPHVYAYINGKGAPRADARKLIAKALDIPEAALIARKPGQPAPAPSQAVAVIPATTKLAPARVGDVLSFVVSGDGMARIKLDATLPLATATPLFRMLLDAGIVFGEAPS